MSEANDHHPEFEGLLDYIYQRHGFDFRGYKRSSLRRRIEKRMHEVGRGRFGEYLALLEVEPREYAQLVDTILINVTGFFRDEGAWEAIRQNVLPRILTQKNGDDAIRVWCAGCATGEEAYSLAIVFAEGLGLQEFQRRVKIYATDLDEGALASARNAIYSAASVGAVPGPLVDRYFENTGGSFTFRRDMRKSVIFGRHNLLADPPISRLDLIACRNLLIYLDVETQSQVLPRLHYAMIEGGYLFLGKAETQIASSKLFETVDLRNRIFRKRGDPPSRSLLNNFGSLAAPANGRGSANPQLYEEMINAVPLAMIGVAADGLVTIINAAARRLFGLVDRDLGQAFQNLQISYRPVELRSRIDEAVKTRLTVRIDDVESFRSGNEASRFTVQIIPLFDNGRHVATAIAFAETTRVYDLQRQLETANHMLETTMEELQSANEELETTNEEIQSTNEELETTNEELQSTNEELETTNEELRSTNDELETTNEVLRARTEQLERQRAYTEAVLGSIGTGVIVVDRELRVTSWNRWNESVWGLRREEVEGQLLLSLDIGLPVDLLEQRLRHVLSGEAESEEIRVEALNRRGRSFACHANIAALPGESSKIAGAIVVIETLGDQR